MAEQEETQQILDEKMERWVYLNDLAEQIEAQKGGEKNSFRMYIYKNFVTVQNPAKIWL